MKAFLAACIFGLTSLGVIAQTSPDFSGTWNMDMSRSDAAVQGGPVGPIRVMIRQSPEEIQVETIQNGTTQAVRYLPERGQAPVGDEPVGTFRWEGNQLITNLIAHINQQAVTVTEVRRLNPTGTEMTVAVTFVVQHGYQSGAIAPGSTSPPNSSTGTNVFLKAR